MAIYCLMQLLSSVWLMLALSVVLVRPLPLSQEAREEALLAQSAMELIGGRIPASVLEDDHEPVAPSQTVEIRLHHPQLLSPTADHAEEEAVPISRGNGRAFGRRIDMQQQQQQQPNFGALSSGRSRSKDSEGSALRRAVTGSPAAQKLIRQQHSASETVVTPSRKSIGSGNTGTPTTAPSWRSQSSANTNGGNGGNLATGSRKENVHFNKNRFTPSSTTVAAASAPAASVVTVRGGDTPASTSTDPTSTQWLFGTHANKEGFARPKLLSHQHQVDSYRLVNGGERWLQLLGQQRAGASTTSTTPMPPTTTTTAFAVSEITTITTSITTEIVVVEDDAIDPITTTPLSEVAEQGTEVEEDQVITTTVSPVSLEPTSTSTFSPSTTQSAFTAEKVYGTPEINWGTPETIHGKPELVYGSPETTTAKATTTTTTATTTISSSLQKEATDGLSGEFETRPQDGAGRPFPEDEDEDELGAGHQSLDSGDDDDAVQEPGEGQKYLVEEKTPDGYIVGEFGVMSPSSGSLRGVRYVAHGSINPQLIKEALRTFLSLKK